MKKGLLTILFCLLLSVFGMSQDVRINSVTTTGAGTGQVTMNASSGGGSVGFRAPASTTSNANIWWTLPTTDAIGCFSSNGSGVLSIVTCGSGGNGSGVTYISVNCAQTSVAAGDTLTSTGAFATECQIPANALAVGSVIHVASGGQTITGTNASSFQFAIKLCTVSGCATGSVNSFGVDNSYTQNASTTGVWRVRGDFPVLAIGTSASLMDQYDTLHMSGAAEAVGAGGGSTVGFDSTVNEYLTIYENAGIASGASVIQKSLVVWVTH